MRSVYDDGVLNLEISVVRPPLAAVVSVSGVDRRSRRRGCRTTRPRRCCCERCLQRAGHGPSGPVLVRRAARRGRWLPRPPPQRRLRRRHQAGAEADCRWGCGRASRRTPWLWSARCPPPAPPRCHQATAAAALLGAHKNVNDRTPSCKTGISPVDRPFCWLCCFNDLMQLTFGVVCLSWLAALVNTPAACVLSSALTASYFAIRQNSLVTSEVIQTIL